MFLMILQVQEKLDKAPPDSRSDPSIEGQDMQSLLRAEDVYKILCNDVVSIWRNRFNLGK
jgi:hypothetical protein